MKEEQGLEVFETTLDQAVRQMRELEQRLKAGEEVSEDEIDAIAKQAASRLEDALDVLQDMLASESEDPAPAAEARTVSLI